MAEARIEVRKRATRPTCTKKTTQKADKGKHRNQKYLVIQGRGAKSQRNVCWACANGKEKAAIKRVGGGPKDA